MKFNEKTIHLCCEWEKCFKSHIKFHLTKRITSCKKLAIHTNAIIQDRKNSWIVKELNEYLVQKKRFVK